MPFPDGFLWGSATAAHQVEGDNTASDCWALEHTAGSPFAEPSGDGCDHYRMYGQDLALLADLGFNTYRFSIEWARVEPEDGHISRAAIAHYRDVLAKCHAVGLTPLVTLHHFTSPKWLMRLGGWEFEGLPERFAGYCRTVMSALGPMIPYVCTLNEPNIALLIRRMIQDPAWTSAPPAPGEQAPVGVGARRPGEFAQWRTAVADALGTAPENVNIFLFTFSESGMALVKAAHRAARAAIREVSPATRVGLTLALQDYQALPGGEDAAAERWREAYEDFLPTIEGDDFLGVQTYSRVLLRPDGMPTRPADAELTQVHVEFYPEALENVLRRAAVAGLPMIVTENGIATADDSRRVEYIRRALAGVECCLADGIDVRGYCHWSALDNFEWTFGYTPTFGLIAVDRQTFKRTVKDSARYLGGIARCNALP